MGAFFSCIYYVYGYYLLYEEIKQAFFIQATVGEARAAVLVDLVRSVMARWEMHCDSLVEEPPSPITGAIIHEPPRRVFLEGVYHGFLV